MTTLERAMKWADAWCDAYRARAGRWGHNSDAYRARAGRWGHKMPPKEHARMTKAAERMSIAEKREQRERHT